MKCLQLNSKYCTTFSSAHFYNCFWDRILDSLNTLFFYPNFQLLTTEFPIIIFYEFV